MTCEIEFLLENYVMADRLYKLELDKEFTKDNRWKEFEDCRNSIAIDLANALAKEKGYLGASTKRNGLGFWTKGEEVEDYEMINLHDCFVNYLRNGRTVVIENGKITNVS